MNKPEAAALRLPDLAQLDPATRERIEQAVLDIFSQREFHRVGLIEIARGGNVSLQTIYKYYGSKEALLFSTLDSELQRLAARMIDHLQGIENYKERLRKTFWVSLDFFEKNPRVLQILMSSVYINTWRRSGAYEHRPLFSTFIKVLAEGRASGVLTSEVDEKTLLDFIYGVVQRTVQAWVVRGMKDPPTRQANVLFEMLWRSIAKPE
ncbi:TetR family transcriptional regulator [Panacagrimonas perspica]|uniref:TetR family transcriptional regulator n=1 Tax=Panacagrimonas perspica TaxID=381431 RepID=A0A4S3K5A3_9GAMM|nr:TetR/AcrR family transcriptional regulator [Panacagrimonas perspica]TDU31465.1 TetR family transcriptional regulator [Panacagrimonas perspica]THD03290.1 TetR family transcriptional regulator [Panacagrimonas perspica]